MDATPTRRIVAISGSLRAGSLNTSLLQALPSLAPASFDITFADLTGIPVYSEELDGEHARLTALAKVNPSIREEEIAAIAAELDALREALSSAAPRLDAIRFVCSADIAAR